MKKIICILITFLLISCTEIEHITRPIYRRNVGDNPVVKIKLSTNSSDYRGDIYFDGNDRINEVRLEDYLYSVVASEMPRRFNIEALKAQAVAARTYAVNRLLSNNGSRNYDMFDDQRSQAYNGIKQENEKVRRAVDSTRGIILTYNDNPIDALYTASCGSKTLAAIDYFGKDYPYLQSVDDYSQEEIWKRSINLEDLKNILNSETENIEDVDNLVYLDDMILTKKQFKLKMHLRSPRYTVKLIDGVVYINGEGYGHCVGMSQVGANNLAKKGYDYVQILKHYYTNVELKRIYQ